MLPVVRGPTTVDDRLCIIQRIRLARIVAMQQLDYLREGRVDVCDTTTVVIPSIITIIVRISISRPATLIV